MNYLPLDRLVAAAGGEDRALIAELLAARAVSAAAGNRRPLFARMDELLARGPDHAAAPGDWVAASRLITSSVRLARMRLKNWKAFERADLVLPEGSHHQTMIVISGANGFGKSSILEAYALTLFGARAFSDIGFLISGAGKRGELRRSYRSMIERSLHRSGRALDEGIAAVVLDFEGGDGPFSIERKWYFDEHGSLIEEDEELLLRVGTERRPLDVPEGQNQQDWYQAEIERRVMPADLAPFFLFDGEQIDRWAERELSEQVRQALTRMLGLVDLQALASDLLDFARDRERGASLADEVTLLKLDAAIDSLADQLAAEEVRLGDVERELSMHRSTRAASLEALAKIADRSHADLQVELEAQHRLEADRKRLSRELINVLADHGPMLFAGVGLIERARTQVEGEQAADGLRLQCEEIALLWQRFVAVEPVLDAREAEALRARFERACAGEAAPGAIDSRHLHLDRQTRRTVIERLATASRTGTARVGEAAAMLADVETALAESRNASTRYAQDLARIADLQSELTETNRAIAENEAALSAIVAEIAKIRAALDPQRSRRDALRQLMIDSVSRLRAAERARAVATGILAEIDEAADAEHQRFADAVTASFRALSHKDQIAGVEISRLGGLRLLDHNGHDVTDYRLSAGETQLFAMALIAAVGTLVGDRLPLMIDTPLGRLDTEHRQRVLDLLSRRTAQTIILTQPEELHPAHLERIRSAIAGTIQLDHGIDESSGIGVSMIATSLEEVAA